VSYARDRNAYTGRRRYEGAVYAYTHVRTIVDELDKLGLIHHDRAWPGRFGLRSRMRATQALITAIGPIDQLEYHPGEVIRLKDAGGRLVDYGPGATNNCARNHKSPLAQLKAKPRI
jgi:hypothetical protein